MAGADGPAGDETVERLAREHHIDREALVAQLRALGSAVEHLADAVELLADEDDDEVAEHLDEARWALREIW